MIVIVTGGRGYAGTGLVEALDALEREHPRFTLFVGDCPTGADPTARDWAIARSVAAYKGEGGRRWREFRADWRSYRKGSGPRRNANMVKLAQTLRAAAVVFNGVPRPVICLAAPGGRGTADCVRRCREAGFEVREVTT